MSEQEAVTIPSAVQRVDDATGSHIEPPLDENWSDLQKLQWHAAVTALDTGCEVTVKEVRRNLFSVSWRTATMSTSTSGSPFYVTWTYLSGMAAGATARVSEVAAVEARVRREAAVIAFHRCADVHPERHDMGAGGGVCAACRSWGEHVAAALSPADGAGS